ncbi:MAG: 3-dehydroquinate synthase, partial [Gammaproteobacteria bacterium]
MLNRLLIGKGNAKYPVFIGKGACSADTFHSLISKEKKILLLTDKNIPNLYISKIKRILTSQDIKVYVYEISPGEKSKSFVNFQKIHNFLSKNTFLRTDGVVACGGGVVGDLSGFVASTYMRGISYFQVPTSLLAQVDSSVGGKTAINLPSGKNLVGAFYNPKGVFIDTDFLDSLGEREYKSGLAEIIKHALIDDKNFAKYLLKYSKLILARDSSHLKKIITQSLKIKAKIVSIDEKEQGVRAFLNFGHTVGHALEHFFGSQLMHGEAIAYGMAYESKMSLKTLKLRKNDYKLINDILQSYGFDQQIHAPFEKLKPFMLIDKKNTADQLN